MSIHILPVNDLKPHTEDSTCECKPRVEIVSGEMIIIHNAFDKREFLEMVNTELSELEANAGNRTE